MVRNLKFIGFMPNIIECIDFIPSKYKTHNTFINKAMHLLCTPVVVSALFFSSAFPDLSTGLVTSTFFLHTIGHFLEGTLN